jgi:hypothetical protein
VSSALHVQSRLWTGLLAGWLAVVAAGTALLWRYKSTPGAAGHAPERWPDGTTLARTPGVPALVMLAHPQCPCTRASVTELAVLMARFGGRLAATVVFVHPDGVDDDWDATELSRRAAAIPGVRVVRDDGGREAARFGAEVSGQTLLYDGDGRLRFQGGITNARGHEGDSAGLRRITAILGGAAPERNDAPVFGCALHDAEPEELTRR